MRVGICQFAPQIRDVEGNCKRADGFLEHVRPGDLDLLVLPELALTGYNFASLEDITPFLEPTAAGVSASWARNTAARLRCLVTIGYPEISASQSSSHNLLQDDPIAYEGRENIPDDKHNQLQSRTYNSLLTVSPDGKLVAHYRKTNLFYTDASWSWPNPDGYGSNAVEMPLKLFPGSKDTPLDGDASDNSTPTAFAICMDFNPKQFTAPWEDYELATNIKHTNARLLIAANAWLTHKSHEELQGAPDDYDGETLSYWVQRLRPLLEDGGGWVGNLPNEPAMTASDAAADDSTPTDTSETNSKPVVQSSAGRQTERIFVIANRVGHEDGEVKACDLTRGHPPLPGESDPVWISLDEARRQAAQEHPLDEITGAEPMISAPDKEVQNEPEPTSAAREARYAGSSCVFGLRGDGRIRMYGNLGRAREKLLVVDTNSQPEWIGMLRGPN